MTNVVSHPRFLSTQRLSELRQDGTSVDRATLLAAVPLPEPAYGETLVDEATDEELAIFVELAELHKELESLGREIIGRRLAQMGDRIRMSDKNTSLMDALKEDDGMDFASENERSHFFRLQQRTSMLHSALYFHLGERLNAHDWRLGFRSRGRIVKIEKR